MMQCERKRNSGKICRRSGRVQKRALASPRTSAIFCRNALIYFDRPIQQRVVQHLEQRLAPGGYLFTSHSESLNGLSHRLAWVAPAVYQRGPR